MRALEWTREQDRHFGPFLYAKEERSSGWALIASSADDDGGVPSLRLTLGRRTFMMLLPHWLIPAERTKVKATYWSAEEIARMGRDWYWNIEERQFGLSLFEGHLSLRYGRQTNSSRETKSKGWFLPWTQWRHVRYSVYLPDHTLAKDFLDGKRKRGDGLSRFEAQRAFEETLPKSVFEFKDYDGEQITATTFISEREWRFGEGWFKWLSLFRKPKIRRSLEIQFSAETGRRKGSWKGGTIGHGIDMAAGEPPAEAFKRYCAEHDMTFVRQVPA